MNTDRFTGLSSEDARQRLAEYGRNRLPEPASAGVLLLFLRQFLSPFIYILIVAAAASLLIRQIPSAVFIIAVLLINSGIGTVQEYAAQRSANALRKLVRGVARVRRDGIDMTIDSENVVPGDIVLLSSGDRVPVDLRLFSSQDLSVDESMLTGESLAVSKTPDADTRDDQPTAERIDMCFAGTVVTRGRGRGVVSATALETKIGGIAKQVSTDRVSEPPLMIRIRHFTYRVAFGIGIAIAALVLLMLLKGSYAGQEIAMMVIGLAVSTIPEGLPAALTVALAIGMSRMAKRHVIIRKLLAVESLGSCTFICSDKTGTLTVNELTIKMVLLPDGPDFDVSGEGIGPGEVESSDQLERLRDIAKTGVFANESHLDYAGGDWTSDGDIVDVAFLVLAKKLGQSIQQIREEQQQLDMIPYESERALSGSLTQCGDQSFLHVKGSPEKLVEMSTHTLTAKGREPIDKAAITAQFEAMASDGYRVIALARRDAGGHGSAIDHLADLTFLGLVAMIDPVRPEARDSIEQCRKAGIEVAMVTGDHPATALAIARQLGLTADSNRVVIGRDLVEAEKQGQDALTELITQARVFARIEPLQKQQIVDTLMREGHFVAVTGDGVNDAPAMRRANAGIAMGKRGTDVAKEAADLIITDDRFSSIVNGVEEGRVVYNNIRKVIGLLIATGFSALLLFFLTVLAGLPMPMIAVQLLWLNLIANGVQDVALAFEPKEGRELSRPPRHPDEPVFERHIIEHVLVVGGAMGLLAFGVFYWLVDSGQDIDHARNLTLMLMVLFGNIHALSSRSETRSLFRIPLFSNPMLICAVPLAQLVHIAATQMPGLSDVLGLQPITLTEWLMLLGVSLVLLLVEEVHKMVNRARLNRQAVTAP